MYHINIIQASLDYIEDNLKAEISVEELADLAGYSVYHYERIFKKLVGIPIARYIKRRRLLHAAFDIASGQKIIDTAIDYGFNTNAGFYKAFHREFGAGPSEYVAAHIVKCPYRMKLIQEEHVLITHEKIKEMLTFWNLQAETISDFHNPNFGQRRDNTWQIGDGYIIQAGTNRKGLDNHILVSKALHERGFEVVLPVQTNLGKDYVMEGELYFFLSRRVGGTVLDGHALFSENGAELAYALGQAVGELDAALAVFDFICNEPNLSEQMKHFIPRVEAAANISKSFLVQLQERLDKFYPDLPKQIIHRDPNPGNIIVQGSKITGFLDFEQTEKNIRIFDPCYAATAILSEIYETASLDREKWPEILRGIIAGYDSVVHLTAAEWAAIPYVIYAIQVICVAFFSDYEKFKALAEVNTKMLEWLIAHDKAIQQPTE